MSRPGAELTAHASRAGITHIAIRLACRFESKISRRVAIFFELSLLSDIKNLLLIKFIIYLRREPVV